MLVLNDNFVTSLIPKVKPVNLILCLLHWTEFLKWNKTKQKHL